MGMNDKGGRCGFTSINKIKEISECVDLFLFDYKETNSKLHKKFTGINNDVILENLSLLNDMRKSIILRCPIIPGCNDRKEHFEGICNVADKFEHILHIEIEPYHSIALLDKNAISCGATVTNISLDEQLIKNDEYFEKTVDMFETYFKNGGIHFQLTYVSREDLLAAKENPENYGNLRVRVTGFSDYFVNLKDSIQDDIIERTIKKN